MEDKVLSNVILYHATPNINKFKIIHNGFKVPKVDWAHFYTGKMKKEPGSLGTGIYGFLNDKELAQQFGQRANQYGDCSIIRFKVGLDEDKGLNFVHNLDDMGYFRSFLLNPKVSRQLDNLRSIYKSKYKQHSLDGALIEYFIQELQRRGSLSKIEYVSCATTTDIYQEIKTFIPNGIEYCIRDGNLIESVEED